MRVGPLNAHGDVGGGLLHAVEGGGERFGVAVEEPDVVAGGGAGGHEGNRGSKTHWGMATVTARWNHRRGFMYADPGSFDRSRAAANSALPESGLGRPSGPIRQIRVSRLGFASLGRAEIAEIRGKTRQFGR